MDNRNIVSTLNDLIETSRDGEYGFNACAEHAASEQVRNLFRTRAQDCRAGALELENLVRQCGGSPDQGGSATGAMHRGWVAVLGTIAGTSDHRMLEEAKRGEDHALARYRKALKQDDLPPTVRTVIERQLAGVQRNHDQVKALRDSVGASA
jgi:uncharacterized protein (TIGR02284 family)